MGYIMSYSMTIVQKPTYLHATITGRNTKENVVAYFRELFAECQARGCFRVLIEERLEGPRLRLIDIYDVAQMGSVMARGTIKAVAYVDINKAGDLLQFAEDVAVNQGLTISVCDTVAEAEQWLLSKR